MKTYLFDIGNVLLAFDFPLAFDALKGASPDPQALPKIMHKKDLLESGLILEDAYIQWVSELLDFKGNTASFKHSWCHIFTPIQETWQLVNQLKAQNHRLILYSNTNAMHASFFLEHYSIFKQFDHAVFSHEMGAMKPQDAFFLKSFEQYSIDPQYTYYIDDLPENIAAGKKHGLHCHLYQQKTITNSSTGYSFIRNHKYNATP